MTGKNALMCSFGTLAALGSAMGQGPEKVDFRRDVQPLLREYCISCHGPTQQMNSFRLDRRKDALRGGTITVISPNNSEGSRLYSRLISTNHGPQMPPTGALPAEKVELIKKWIDQGAEWPDEASGEAPPAPRNPDTTKLMEAIRAGDNGAYNRTRKAHPEAVKSHGVDGATPLMFAALYGTPKMVRELLAAGADSNSKNESGATALMWAVEDPEKTRLLLAAGADPNAQSEDLQTPLLIATSRKGAQATVALLLNAGAKPNVDIPVQGRTPLSEAARVGDAATLRLLLDHGADRKMATPVMVGMAVRAGCEACLDLLGKGPVPELYTAAVSFTIPPFGDGAGLQRMLDGGLDAKAQTMLGHPLLIAAASSDHPYLPALKTLIDKGADVNAKATSGETAMQRAKLTGNAELVNLLRSARAADENTPAASPAPRGADSIQTAVSRTLPLLQRSDRTFLRKSGCVSCHNNTLTALSTTLARRKRFAVDEEIAREQVSATSRFLSGWRDRYVQGVGIPGGPATAGYLLWGLETSNYPSDTITDAVVHFLRSEQGADGHWEPFSHRPPMESSAIQTTALAMRMLQTYAPKPRRGDYDRSVRLARTWLSAAQPKTNEDYVFQVLGLRWAGGDGRAVRERATQLAAQQRSDGGWGQLPSLPSDAYATGQALYALYESGAVPAQDPVFRRGVRFLLDQQLEDGSWYVRSRSLPIQPYFESDFPHGSDQWISAAATNWATLALLQHAP